MCSFLSHELLNQHQPLRATAASDLACHLQPDGHRRSDRVAIEATDAILTYGELADAARGFAGWLRLTRVLPSLTAGTHEDRGKEEGERPIRMGVSGGVSNSAGPGSCRA